MDGLIYFLVGGALALALIALKSARGMRQEFEDSLADVRRMVRGVQTEVSQTLDVQRRLLAAVARGADVTEEMIVDGQLWRDIDGKVAAEIAQESGVTIVDVRTAEETRSGIIPGSKLIPIDELEARRSEIPNGSGKILLYCAGGSRSAAGCEYLSSEGYNGLFNLDGGFGAWTGPIERP